MLKKCSAFLLCAALLVPLLFGCGRKNDISSGAGAKDFPVTIPTAAGSVTLGSAPTGAAVLSANTADVILALGYEIGLKAKSADCTQSDLTALPDVTASDADKIKSLGADLVFTDSPLTADQQSAMAKAGITVLVLKPAADRADLSRLYSQVGSALKGAKTGYEKGKKIAEGLLETIDDVTRVVPASKTPITAVYLYNTEGGAATGDTIAGGLVKSAGLTNVAEDSRDGKIPVDELMISNPKYIFCAKGVKDPLTSSSQFKKLTAVQQGRVYEMDPGEMTLQGERMVDAVSFMAGTVFPQLLQSTSSAADNTGASSSSPAASGSASSGSASSGSSSSDSGMNLDQTLKSGMQGSDVLKMQNRLLELGYMFIKPSGLFAEGTEQSVKDFQYLNGLGATGIADPATLHKMFSPDAKKRLSQ